MRLDTLADHAIECAVQATAKIPKYNETNKHP